MRGPAVNSCRRRKRGDARSGASSSTRVSWKSKRSVPRPAGRTFRAWPAVERKDFSLMDKLMQYLSDESGASAAEYALILALVAIVIIGGLTVLGTAINNVLSYSSSYIST